MNKTKELVPKRSFNNVLKSHNEQSCKQIQNLSLRTISYSGDRIGRLRESLVKGKIW